MELFTLDRNFKKREAIDTYDSAIWTERYYGDSEVELNVPVENQELLQMLKIGTFLGYKEVDEIMILETHEIQEGKCKISGISLCKWLNNRFIRSSAKHEDRYWNVSNIMAGELLVQIVQNWCINSGYLNGTIPIGVANPQALKIPGLTTGGFEAGPWDGLIQYAVPFGPVYDALRAIAETKQLGMTLYLEKGVETSPSIPYSLKFKSYRGDDRSSTPWNLNYRPLVRFTPQLETFTNISELQSIADYKNLAYVYAPGLPGITGVTPGMESSVVATGFDLRAEMVFAEEITTDQIGGSAAVLGEMLEERAKDTVYRDRKLVKLVDGEIVPTELLKFKEHYWLGDLVEVQGHSGEIDKVRVTEYIHSKDDTGLKQYPTLTIFEE